MIIAVTQQLMKAFGLEGFRSHDLFTGISKVMRSNPVESLFSFFQALTATSSVLV